MHRFGLAGLVFCYRFLFYILSAIGLSRMRRNLDVKSRLGEIARRSAELSAVSSKLSNMALQLDQLRKLSGRTELLGNGNCITNRKYDRYLTYRLHGDDQDST